MIREPHCGTRPWPAGHSGQLKHSLPVGFRIVIWFHLQLLPCSAFWADTWRIIGSNKIHEQTQVLEKKCNIITYTVSDKNSSDTSTESSLFLILARLYRSSECCLSHLTHQILYTNIVRARRQKSVPAILTETVVYLWTVRVDPWHGHSLKNTIAKLPRTLPKQNKCDTSSVYTCHCSYAFHFQHLSYKLENQPMKPPTPSPTAILPGIKH